MAVKGEDRASLGLGKRRSEGDLSAKVRDIQAYRIGLDETIPPMPLRDLLASGGASICILSTDETLFDTVQTASGEQYPVDMVDAWWELEAVIESGHCGIALIDAALLGDELIERIETLARYADRLVTLVAADRADAEKLIGMLADRKIHRLLIKPPAPGITRLLIESAVSRCIQLREKAAEAGPAPSATEPVRRAPSFLPKRWRLPAAVTAVLAVLAIAVLAAVSWRSSSPVPPAPQSSVPPAAESPGPVPPVVDAPSPAPGRFDKLLAAADRAFDEGRLGLPKGDNALDYYLTILAADPEQAVARDRLGVIVDALFTQAETALLDGSLDSAGALLDQIRRADPSSPRLAFLDAQLKKDEAEALAAAARARKPEPPAAPAHEADAAANVPAAPRAPTELENLLAAAEARLAHGEVLQPAGDGAKDYFDRAFELAPAAPEVVALRGRLAESMVESADARFRAGELDAAVELVLAARNLGADSEQLTDLESRIGAANAAAARAAHDELMAAARQRIASGALIEPRDDSARYYLDLLGRQDQRYPGLSVAWGDFGAAVADRASAAIESRSWADADHWLDVLNQVPGSNSAKLAQLKHERNTRKLQDDYLATATPPTDLKLVSYEPPVYPSDALRAGVQGWVELEFVVGRDGRTRDVVAVGADPVGRFEEAAIAAVSSYRYAPFERDGEVFERRVRLRVRFALQ